MKLTNSGVTTTLAVTDLDAARDFYGNKLGLKEMGTLDDKGMVVYQVGPNHLCVYRRGRPARSEATVCSFDVDDVEGTVKELQGKGIRFEEYDIPEMGLKTQNGVAKMGDSRAAWFKDPDGNILGISNELATLKRNAKGATISAEA